MGHTTPVRTSCTAPARNQLVEFRNKAMAVSEACRELRKARRAAGVLRACAGLAYMLPACGQGLARVRRECSHGCRRYLLTWLAGR